MKKLSVIIPTRNRQEYCYLSVKNICDIVDRKNLSIEIVVADNSDNNSLQNKIVSLNKEYIKYDYSNEVRSFVDNFQYSYNLSEGEYILFLGDDDGILPHIMDIINIADQYDIDAIIPALKSTYFWPGNDTIIKGGKEGLLINVFCKVNIKKIDTLKGIKQLVKNGAQDYQKIDVARVYHGIVHRRVIERIIGNNFKLFAGLTPDIYSSVLLSAHAKKAIRISIPLTISGICPKSGSSDSATGKHTGKLEDAPHFKGHADYQWDKKIPEFYSVETIWAETTLKALKELKLNNEIDMFNLEKLYAILIIKYPEFKTEINKSIVLNKLSRLKIKTNKFKVFLNKTIFRIFRRLMLIGKVKKIYNIESISKATLVSENQYSKYSLKICKKVKK